HDIPAAARARGTRGAFGASASGEGSASQRDAFHQLLHADGDADTGPRSRISRSPARVGSHSDPALLRGQDRRPSPAKSCRGTAGGGYLTEATEAVVPIASVLAMCIRPKR